MGTGLLSHSDTYNQKRLMTEQIELKLPQCPTSMNEHTKRIQNVNFKYLHTWILKALVFSPEL